jgi:hypothetical protein
MNYKTARQGIIVSGEDITTIRHPYDSASSPLSNVALARRIIAYFYTNSQLFNKHIYHKYITL